MQYELDPIVQWNLVIKRSDITKPSYNKVILLVPALYELTINLDKTYYMVFRPHNLNIDTSSLNITLNDHKIQNVKFTKFLGVTIDEHLSWKYYVNDIACKISRVIGVLNRLKGFLPLHILVNLYNTMILPHITYCIVWGKCAKYLYITKTCNSYSNKFSFLTVNRRSF